MLIVRGGPTVVDSRAAEAIFLLHASKGVYFFFEVLDLLAIVLALVF
jgi:hypothetical protein